MQLLMRLWKHQLMLELNQQVMEQLRKVQPPRKLQLKKEQPRLMDQPLKKWMQASPNQKFHKHKISLKMKE
jgi:hypothetical protein